MSKDLKDKLVAAVTELRTYFKSSSPHVAPAPDEDYAADVYANITGELFVIMPYKKFVKLIIKTKTKSEIV